MCHGVSVGKRNRRGNTSVLMVTAIFLMVAASLLIAGQLLVQRAMVNVTTTTTPPTTTTEMFITIKPVTRPPVKPKENFEGRAVAGDFYLSGSFKNHTDLKDAQKLLAEQLTKHTRKCNETKRFGDYDVCMSDKYKLSGPDCLAYSFGVKDGWQFDEEMQKHGCEVRSFDPSIGKSSHRVREHHYFEPIGLWGEDTTNAKGWKLHTLDKVTVLMHHSERVIDVLKIDAEGGEWPALKQWLTYGYGLGAVKQLVVQLHSPKFMGNGNATKTNKTNLTLSNYAAMTTSLNGLRDQLDLHLHSHRLLGGECCKHYAPMLPAGSGNLKEDLCCLQVSYVNIRWPWGDKKSKDN